MDYFANCTTAEECKARYRALAKQVHPDAGGSKEAFQRLQSQFAAAWERLKSIHVTHTGERYTADTDETANDFMDIIDRLLRMDGVTTELIGSWIWATGNTRQYAGELKSLGFRFSRPKSAWYYHSGAYRRRHDREYTLADIRTMYDHTIYRKEAQHDDKLSITAR